MTNAIQREILVPQSRERVWRSLTESALLAEWMFPNDFEPRIGHRFTFRVPPNPKVGFDGLTVHCEVLECEPPSRLAFSWSAGADARYSIFNGGAGRGRVRLSEAQRDAALATYEKSIQTAFREVADALADRGTLGEQLRSASQQVRDTAETATLVDARYREGIDPYLSSLDAQRSFYAAQRAQVAVELAKLQNVATLYQVLGGN